MNFWRNGVSASASRRRYFSALSDVDHEDKGMMGIVEVVA